MPEVSALPRPLMDTDERRREQFISSLLLKQGPELLPILRLTAEKDLSYRIRHQARRHICRLSSCTRYLKTGDRNFPMALPARENQEIQQFLQDNTLDSGDPLIWSAAIDLIIAADLRSLAPRIAQDAMDSQDPYRVSRSIAALSHLQADGLMDILTALTRKWTDPRVRQALSCALWKIGTDKAVMLLVRLANDRNPQARTDAIVWLSSVDLHRASAIVAEMFARGDDIDREAALEAASILALPETLSMITTALAGETRGLALKGMELLQRFQQLRNPFALKLGAALQGLTPLVPEFRPLLDRALAALGAPPAQHWRELMFSSSPAERMEGLRCSGISRDPGFRELLLQRLSQEQDPAIISSLLTAFSTSFSGGTDTLPVLIQLLRHTDKRVRANAVEALRGLSPRIRQPHLKPLLQDESNRVVANALISLGDLWDADCQRALEGLALSDDRVKRFSAVFCVSELGGMSHLQILARLCKDPDPAISTRALETLALLRAEAERAGKTGSELESFDRVFFALSLDPANSSLNPAIRDLPGILREHFNRYLTFLLGTEREAELIETLKYLEMGRDLWTIPHIRPLLKTASPSIRYYARRALYSMEDSLRKAGRRGGAMARRDVTRSLENFSHALASQDSWIRLETAEASAEAAVHLGSEQVAGILRNRLAFEHDSAVLQKLVLFAGLLGGPEIMDTITPFLNHPDPRVRANAVEVCGSLGQEIQEELLLPLLNDQDNRTRANAVVALYHRNPEKAIGALVDMIYSQETWMKDSALFAARTLRDPRVTAALLEAMPHASSLEMAVKIARTLESIGGVHQIPSLQALLAQTRDPRRALVVRHIIEQIGLGSSEINISDLFASENRDGIHGNLESSDIITVQTFRTTDSIYHSLLDELNSPDEMVRKKALMHICESRDPALFPIISLIIERDPSLTLRLLALWVRREMAQTAETLPQIPD